MGRRAWMDRLGSAVGAEQGATIDRHARRWLGAGWAISTLLGFLMPIYRSTTHLHGGVVLGAAVFVMIGVASATRRPLICLTMSAFGLVAGSALGFGLLAALTHRPLFLAITAQMAVGAAFLGRVFARELRPKPSLPEDPFWEEVRRLPEEEARKRVAARMEALHAEIDATSRGLDRAWRGINLTLAGGGVALVGAAIILVGGHTAWGKGAVYAALPLVVGGGIAVLIGARIVKAG